MTVVKIVTGHVFQVKWQGNSETAIDSTAIADVFPLLKDTVF